MSLEPKEVVRRYFDAFNRDPESAFEQYVSDEGLKQHSRAMLSAFPGYQLQVEDLIGEGDRVAARIQIRGTHKGALLGIPPTGKETTVPGIIIFRITDDTIAEHWLQADMLGLMQHLGAMPSTLPQSA